MARAFHLDHLGAQERQQFACVWTGPHLGELDDPNAFQRATPGNLGRLELWWFDRRCRARRLDAATDILSVFTQGWRRAGDARG